MKKGLEGGFEEVEPDLKISGGKDFYYINFLLSNAYKYKKNKNPGHLISNSSSKI